MTLIRENISLRPYNTFGIEANARYLAEVRTVDELVALLGDARIRLLPRLILGGGSNILFTKDFEGLVIKNDLKGITVEPGDYNGYIYIKACSGEAWHSLVLYTLDMDLGGIENLSLIPGTVGAAPIQNIGAYGVELKDVFHSLQALNLDTLQVETFTGAECRFGYRDSYFKGEGKGHYFIVSVTLRLNKHPRLNTSYGAIENTLQALGIRDINVRTISMAVCHIRSSKLPDPEKIGNAGSFFKNPEITAEQFEALRIDFPSIPGYSLEDGRVKVPAGWLIEQCGWKGKRVGDTGSHKDQALVLVNYGNAKGDEVYSLALMIKSSVAERFGIEILPEVNMV